MTSDLRQQAIRELAYLKWEQAGSPPGNGVFFWLEAEQELLAGGLEAIDEPIVSIVSPPLKTPKGTAASRKRAG